jgi:oxaloacetate decarboxylase gamma subunit
MKRLHIPGLSPFKQICFTISDAQVKGEDGMEIHLVAESVKFMVLGVATVFVFLYLLVWLMRLQAFVVSRRFPVEEELSSSRMFRGEKAEYDEEEDRRMAAAVAAVHKYRGANSRTKGSPHG